MTDAAERVLFDPAEMGGGDFYRVLNSVVVPRPIAWVCSRSADGVLNLAPHSFYTVACVSPPVVQFTSVGRKDSLRNVEATGEFTVSLAPEALFEQINATAPDFPSGMSEAEQTGVRLEPAERVAAMRVVDSPLSLVSTQQAICAAESAFLTRTAKSATQALSRCVQPAPRVSARTHFRSRDSSPSGRGYSISVPGRSTRTNSTICSPSKHIGQRGMRPPGAQLLARAA